MLEKLMNEMFRLWRERHELEAKKQDLFLINLQIENVEYAVRKEMGVI